MDTAAFESFRTELFKRMWNDLAAIYQHSYQTWGRQVKIIWRDFGKSSTPDEVQQRAMAAEVATLKPFLVIAGGGGPVFSADPRSSPGRATAAGRSSAPST